MVYARYSCLSQTKELQKYIIHGSDHFKFQLQLHNANLLLQPIAHGLLTLEGQNTMCSDVFFVFIGIVIGFTRVFQDPSKSWTNPLLCI